MGEAAAVLAQGGWGGAVLPVGLCPCPSCYGERPSSAAADWLSDGPSWPGTCQLTVVVLAVPWPGGPCGQQTSSLAWPRVFSGLQGSGVSPVSPRPSVSPRWALPLLETQPDGGAVGLLPALPSRADRLSAAEQVPVPQRLRGPQPRTQEPENACATGSPDVTCPGRTQSL